MVELAGRRPLVLEEERVVDLLVVLDDGVARSPAMARSLERLSGLIEGLSRSDLDGDGRRDVPDWRSVHVGVIDADRGAPGADTLEGCSELERGLLRVGDASCAVDRAEGVPEGVLRFGPNVSPSSDSADLACLVSSRRGCALPQPLEAALEALSPEAPEPWTRPGYVPPRFADADGREILPGLACSAAGGCAHAGLLQPESVLVVVVITERDDCSLTDTGVLEAGVSLPTACARADAAGGLREVQRYVDGLVGLRADPARLVLAIQAGLPTDAVGPLDAVLGDPRLAPREEGGELVPSCATSEVSATPPTRWLEVARQLSAVGARVVLGSICERDADFVAQLRAHLAEASRPLCLASGAEREQVLLDRCVVRESLLPGMRCDERSGRVLLGLDASGAEVCALRQVAPGAANPGWFFDDEALAAQAGRGCLTAHPTSVRVTSSTAPHGALRVTCRYVNERRTADVICDESEDASAPCTEGMLCHVADDRCGLGGTGLVCDAFQLRCMRHCERDEDCPDGFEESGLCDPRTAGEVADRELVPRSLLEPGRVEQPRRVCASLVCGGP